MKAAGHLDKIIMPASHVSCILVGGRAFGGLFHL